jgi:hypothetical protein
VLAGMNMCTGPKPGDLILMEMLIYTEIIDALETT